MATEIPAESSRARGSCAALIAQLSNQIQALENTAEETMVLPANGPFGDVRTIEALLELTRGVSASSSAAGLTVLNEAAQQLERLLSAILQAGPDPSSDYRLQIIKLLHALKQDFGAAAPPAADANPRPAAAPAAPARPGRRAATPPPRTAPAASTLRLRAAPPRRHASSEPSARQPTVSGERKRILLVDDEPVGAAATRLHLLEAGYDCTLVLSGNAAIDWLRSNKADLVILDVVMPVLSGFDVCRWIRQNVETRHVPVIFLTHKDEPKDILEGRSIGSDLYLSKPAPRNKLLNLVGLFLSPLGCLKRKTAPAQQQTAPPEIEVPLAALN
jgi:CheY-like chemotaxis protein